MQCDGSSSTQTSLTVTSTSATAFNNTGTLGLHNYATVTVKGGFANSGTLDVDNVTGFEYAEGGSSLTIKGTLTNTNIVQIGSTSLTAATTVTLGGLSNSASTDSFTLDGSASHAATLAFTGGASSFTSNGGTFELTYAGPLTLGGAFTNSGTFGIHDNTALTINAAFANSGTLDVDNVTGFEYAEGGSSLTIKGTLTNTNIVQIGSTSLTAATTVTLGGLSNSASTDSFTLDGSASHAATLAFTGGASSFTSNGGTFELTYAGPLTLGGAFTNSGTFGIHDNTALTINAAFVNSGTLDVDNVTGFEYAEGGSSLTIKGTLTNTNIVQIGSTSLTAATTVTLGGFSNSASTDSFTLDGSASHAATLAFTGGASSFTSNGGTFELTYAGPLTLGGAFTNSGTFGIHDNTALTINAAFANSGTLDVDNVTGFEYAEGGSSLTIKGTLTNTNIVQIGSTSLTAATTVTLGELSNSASTDSFTLDGSASHAATLAFTGGASSFTSNGGTFELTYAGPLTLGGAFTNSGTFGIHDNTALTINAAFANSGTLDVDNVTGFEYAEGGSSLTIKGTLTNTNIVQIGSTSLTAATTVTLGGLSNSASTDSFTLDGSASHAATLAFTGGASSFTSNGGTFELTYAGPLTLGGAFTNSGTFGIHDNTALTINAAFANSGTWTSTTSPALSTPRAAAA